MPDTTYAGLTGVKLQDNALLKIGDHIELRSTYAHLMAPFLMAFARPSPGQHHPAPWVAVSGGLGFDIEVEVAVAEELAKDRNVSGGFLAWFIVALLRLRLGTSFVMPAIGFQHFADAAQLGNQAKLFPAEIEPVHRLLSDNSSREISELDARWVEGAFMASGAMFFNKPAFRVLFEACDQCCFTKHEGLALVQLWAGLEAVFSPDKAELRYRVSSSLASYLEPPGTTRLLLQKRLVKLYDSRSSAAHGREGKASVELKDSFAVARRALIRMIDDCKVPSHSELEARVFGADPT